MSEQKHLTFNRDRIREVDACAIRDFGIPGIVLMENASRGVADCAYAMVRGGSVLIICGGGNNGGDGFAAARHLHNRGIRTTIVLLRPRETYQGDARINLDICDAMKLTIVGAADDPIKMLATVDKHDLIMDAVLGTGPCDTIRSPLSDVIRWINESDTPVLAVDLPSGLDCNSGHPLGVAVKAACTVTFVGLKSGFHQSHAKPYVGEIVIADIGVPIELTRQLAED